jgi:hypothetical protein
MSSLMTILSCSDGGAKLFLEEGRYEPSIDAASPAREVASIMHTCSQSYLQHASL